MAVDFTEKAKLFQAIDEIIASGRKLKWNEIISEMQEKYDLKNKPNFFFPGHRRTGRKIWSSNRYRL